MNREIQSIIDNIQNINNGNPWYGRPVYSLLDDIDTTVVYKKPNEYSHSLIELLYHMITWASFTLKRVEGDKEQDMGSFEKLDWREIDPYTHTWQRGVEELKQIHEDIIAQLETKNDDFLEQTVDYRKYNFRFLLHGLVQHNIYHSGQIAYLSKALRD